MAKLDGERSFLSFCAVIYRAEDGVSEIKCKMKDKSWIAGSGDFYCQEDHLTYLAKLKPFLEGSGGIIPSPHACLASCVFGETPGPL